MCACGGAIGADDSRDTSFDIVSCFLYLLFFVGVRKVFVRWQMYGGFVDITGGKVKKKRL